MGKYLENISVNFTIPWVNQNSIMCFCENNSICPLFMGLTALHLFHKHIFFLNHHQYAQHQCAYDFSNLILIICLYNMLKRIKSVVTVMT